jgi:hypothetical protein
MSADCRGGAMCGTGTSVRRPLPGGAGPRALRLMPGRQKACIKSASDCINPHRRDAGRARPDAAPQRAAPFPSHASKPTPQARHAGAEGTALADIKARLPPWPDTP